MKIVFLDVKTIGEDIDLSGYEALGEVVKYDFSTPEQARERTRDADVIILNKVEFYLFGLQALATYQLLLCLLLYLVIFLTLVRCLLVFQKALILSQYHFGFFAILYIQVELQA